MQEHKPERIVMTFAANNITFEVSAESGPMAARTLLEQVLEALKPMEFEADELGTIELVLAEVLNNVAEHAYPENEPQGPIEVSFKTGSDGVCFRVEDSGAPMPDGQLPIGTPADVDVDLMDLPEGGFGWFMIRDLAKDLAYLRESGKNILTLRIELTVPADQTP